MNENIIETKFLILAKIAEFQPRAKQIDIAKELDLTPQAVSEHIKKLKKDKLVDSDSNNLFITKKGVQCLINSIDKVEEEINHIKKKSIGKPLTKAIATEEINKGDPLDLFIEKGVLKAKKSEKKEDSVAVSDSAGKKGEVIEMKRIFDIIDLEEGELKILKVSPNINKTNKELIKSDFDFVFSFGINAISFAQKNQIQIDIKFPTSGTLINYIQRGLDCLALCDEERIKDVLEDLEEKEIEFELITNDE